MSASANDKFMKAGAGTVTTLSAPGKALSATSITVGSTTNYPTDTGIVFAIRQVDVNGELVTGTYTEWAGTVTSGTTLSMDAAPVYGSDQVYPAGSTTQVYIPLSSSAHNKMVDGLLVSHDQDGTLKAGAVETPNIKDEAVTSDKIDFTTGIWWEELGRVVAGSATTTLTVNITAKSFIKVMFSGENAFSGSANAIMQFNGVSGATAYSRKHSELTSGGTFANLDSDTNNIIIGLAPSQYNSFYLLYEGDGKSKGSQWIKGMVQAATTANIRNGWSTTKSSTSITSVSITSSQANGLQAGSTLIVLGHD